MSRLDLTETHRSFEVPMVFLLGRHDRVAPCALAEAYHEQLSEPYSSSTSY